MIELNNLNIKDLPSVLKKETLMEGYWSLINNGETNCGKLHQAGVRDSIALFEVTADPEKVNQLIAETNIPRDYLLILKDLLIHHCFKPISLRKREGMNPESIKLLASKGIKDTGTLLLAGRTKSQRLKLADETKIPIDDLEKMMAAADLMRKPGIKETKVKLLTAFGIHSLQALGVHDPLILRSQFEKLIQETGIVKAVPTPKEVTSDVSWARLYPEIIEF